VSGMDEALAPESFSVRPAAPRRPQNEPKAVEDSEERSLAHLTQQPGWQIYARMTRQDVLDLRTLKDVDLKGKSAAEVGEMYLIANEAAARIEARFNHIEQIAESLQEQGEE